MDLFSQDILILSGLLVTDSQETYSFIWVINDKQQQAIASERLWKPVILLSPHPLPHSRRNPSPELGF
ncbi:MAG: hypothetical protein RIM23_28950 [Coleofasciculus sp. G3-WIS-01]